MSKLCALVLLVGCAAPSTPPVAGAPITPAATPPAPAGPKPFPKLDPAIYAARIAREGQTIAPAIDPLPEYGMGIAACDDLLVRITACRTLPNKPKVFVRAMWDMFKEQLDHGGDRGDIKRQCTEEAESWNQRLPAEQPGC